MTRRSRKQRSKAWKSAWVETPPEPEPPTVPAIRLSLRKEGERWVVTCIKNEYTQSYTEDTAWEAKQLLDDLIGEHTCDLCGAPLWESGGGHVVCSRHLDHYPSAKVVKRYTPTYAWSPFGRGKELDLTPRLPSIKQSHIGRTWTYCTPAKLREWVAKNLTVETVKTVEVHNKKPYTITRTRYTQKEPTKRQKALAHGKWKREHDKAFNELCRYIGERRAEERLASVPAGSVGDILNQRHAHKSKWEEYAILMVTNGIKPRPFAAWLENYEVVRARQPVETGEMRP